MISLILQRFSGTRTEKRMGITADRKEIPIRGWRQDCERNEPILIMGSYMEKPMLARKLYRDLASHRRRITEKSVDTYARVRVHTNWYVLRSSCFELSTPKDSPKKNDLPAPLPNVPSLPFPIFHWTSSVKLSSSRHLLAPLCNVEPVAIKITSRSRSCHTIALLIIGTRIKLKVASPVQ